MSPVQQKNMFDIQNCFCCFSCISVFLFLSYVLTHVQSSILIQKLCWLFTATFQTTDEHLLTMCFGTAPRKSKQSWWFFLLNLRQVLLHYCSEVRDWRRLDRHKGLLAMFSFHFPVSKHLYCVLQILQNLARTRLETITPFWRSRSDNRGICEFEVLMGEKSIMGIEKKNEI